MKKTIITKDWKEAEAMIKRADKAWTIKGEYKNGRRGPSGELGWTENWVEVDGIAWRVTHDCGFPYLIRTVDE